MRAIMHQPVFISALNCGACQPETTARHNRGASIPWSAFSTIWVTRDV